MNNILKLVLAFVLCVGLAAPANAQDAVGVDESETAPDDRVIIDNGGIDLSEDEETSRPGYPARRLPNVKEKQDELRALRTEKRTDARNARTERRNSFQDARSGVDGGGDSKAYDGGDNERRDDEDRFYPNDDERRAEVQEIREEMKERREEKRTEIQGRRDERGAEMDEKRKARRMEVIEKIQERADKFLDRVVDRFEAAIKRVKQIASRVESRLEKIQDERGVDLSKALSLVDEAYAALADAELALDGAYLDTEDILSDIEHAIEADVENAATVLQSQIRPGFADAKDKFREVHEHIKRAHSLLREAVEAAKAALRDGRDNTIDADADGSVGTN